MPAPTLAPSAPPAQAPPAVPRPVAAARVTFSLSPSDGSCESFFHWSYASTPPLATSPTTPATLRTLPTLPAPEATFAAVESSAPAPGFQLPRSPSWMALRVLPTVLPSTALWLVLTFPLPSSVVTRAFVFRRARARVKLAAFDARPIAHFATFTAALAPPPFVLGTTTPTTVFATGLVISVIALQASANAWRASVSRRRISLAWVSRFLYRAVFAAASLSLPPPAPPPPSAGAAMTVAGSYTVSPLRSRPPAVAWSRIPCKSVLTLLRALARLSRAVL